MIGVNGKTVAKIAAICLAFGTGSSTSLAEQSPRAQPLVLNSPITAVIHSPKEVFDGYLFWHQADELKEDVDNISLLTDAYGNLVHTWQTNLTGGGTPAYLLSSGGVLRIGITDRANTRRGPVASSDTVQITDIEGSVVWEINARQLGNLLFHHDVELMPNGNILISTYEPLSAQEALAIGWDPGKQERIWTDGLIEVAPNLEDGTSEVVWRWRVADHIVQDRFEDAPNFGVVADNSGRIDPHYPKSYAPMNVVRQHINSVDYHAGKDQILLSVFMYNEIWVIDHSTTTEEAAGGSGGRSGMGGELLFRYGNPEAYGKGSAEDRLFLKQHDANWIDAGLPGEGNILVHNNNTEIKPRLPTGMSRPGQRPPAMRLPSGDEIDVKEGISNVYELRLQTTDDGFYTTTDGVFNAETVWFWEHPEYFADFQGGARRLPNNNTLVTDTTDDLVVEVNPVGEIVAEYRGATPVYKAFKYTTGEAAPLLTK